MAPSPSLRSTMKGPIDVGSGLASLMRPSRTYHDLAALDQAARREGGAARRDVAADLLVGEPRVGLVEAHRAVRAPLGLDHELPVRIDGLHADLIEHVDQRPGRRVRRTVAAVIGADQPRARLMEL